MDKGAGYIKLWRCIQKHWIWEDPIYAWRFIDLILSANYKESQSMSKKHKQMVTVGRGELWVSIRTLAKKWRCSRNAVTHYLNLLESEKMVTLCVTPYGTIVKVLNYDDYQDFAPMSADTKKDTFGDSKGTEKGQKRVLSKEIKNINKEKEEKEYIEPCGFGGEWE